MLFADPARGALFYLGVLLAVAMELLGIADTIGLRWIAASPIIAGAITYALGALLWGWAWPDASGWIAIGTLVLATGSVGGLLYAGRSSRLLARQTSAAVEASFPYLRLVDQTERKTWQLSGNNTLVWVGTIKVVAGTARAREVKVWVRDEDSFYYAPIGVALPRERRHFAAVASPGLASQCPFPIVGSETFADQFRVWLGVVWMCPDDSLRYNLYAIQRNAGWQAQEFMPDIIDPGFKRPK